MGIFVGNFLGLLAVLAAVGFGYESLTLSSYLYLGIAYGLWLIFLIMDLATRPKVDAPFCRELASNEQVIYRRYHVAIDFPMAGQVYAGLLNFLRVAGLVWAGLCVWKEQYELAGGALVLFIVTASLIHRNNPWLFLGQQASKGQLKAQAELAQLQQLLELRHGIQSGEAVGFQNSQGPEG